MAVFQIALKLEVDHPSALGYASMADKRTAVTVKG